MEISSYGSFQASYLGGSLVNGSMSYEERARLRVQQKKNQNKKGKKKLCYNPREISGALLRSGRASSTGIVLTKARGKLIMLTRSRCTGMYNEKELENAIIHAKKMVRCAKMKYNHQKQEELEQRSNSRRKEQEKYGKGDQTERTEARRKREAQEEELIKLQRIKSRERELEQKCRQHRSKERSKLEEADLEYLKRCAQNTIREIASETASDLTSGYESGVVASEGASSDAAGATETTIIISDVPITDTATSAGVDICL